MIEESTYPQLERTLSDLLLASTLSRLDLLPWLLTGLTDRLTQLMGKVTALVPDQLDLPAPPVYCPQLAQLDEQVLSQCFLVCVYSRLRY